MEGSFSKSLPSHGSQATLSCFLQAKTLVRSAMNIRRSSTGGRRNSQAEEDGILLELAGERRKAPA
jgi:hypothetical protein